MVSALDELVGPLEQACREGFGSAGRVEGLRRLAGGASQETYGFELVEGATRRALILRKDSTGDNPLNDRATELSLVRAARAHGVPSPAGHFLVRFAEGRTGFVMDRVEGEAIARKILRDPRFEAARGRLVAQCGEALAKIHAIARAALPALRVVADPKDAIAELEQRLDSFGEPHPVFELALQFLRSAAPPPTTPRLVHGDFRLGNLMVDETGLCAVLDWELAHLGDPLEDLGWLCVKSWRFGAPLPVAGLGTREALYEAYERAGGEPVDRAAARFWEIYGTLNWGLICKLQASLHLRGVKRSMELAALGRRAVETESDILSLLE